MLKWWDKWSDTIGGLIVIAFGLAVIALMFWYMLLLIAAV